MVILLCLITSMLQVIKLPGALLPFTPGTAVCLYVFKYQPSLQPEIRPVFLLYLWCNSQGKLLLRPGTIS